MKLLVIVHVVVTWYLVGLIWTVQTVQYPLFNRVGEDNFARFTGLHAERITMIVMFPMLIELGTAFLLILAPPKDFPMALVLLGFLLVVIVWISTAMLQIPLHNQLAQGFDEQVVQRLTKTNWVRTIAWTLRGLIMLVLLWTVLNP